MQQVGAIVITSKGRQDADIKEMKDKTFIDAYSARFVHHWNAVTAIRKLIIAAVNGRALLNEFETVNIHLNG